MSTQRFAPDGRPILWEPHAGPQSEFLMSTAHEALYGGMAGGGKSDALLYGALRQTHHPKYRALILRRTFPELRELMDRSLATFAMTRGKWNEQGKRWTWPSGATVEFGYCETFRDVMQYQGQEFAFIGYDELGQVAEERVWTYLLSRNRAAAADLVLQMRASANPGGPGHSWVKRRFVDACPESGTVYDCDGTTRAYFPAGLKDNPTLLANDPTYATRLRQLPELEYRWLALGDWEAGGGVAFPELGKRSRFVIERMPTVPAHWFVWGAFDWGYNHPFSFGLYAADEDGHAYCLDTATGRQMQPPAIADRMLAVMDAHGVRGRVKWVTAGHDVWADVRARSEHVPTLFEQFAQLGVPMVKANISRVSGVQNLRRYLAGDPPRIRWCDTPNNRAVLECLGSLVADPHQPEDVLKVDAVNGVGGDDHYDQVRYGLAARPMTAEIIKAPTGKLPDRAPHFDFDKGRFADHGVAATVDKLLKQEASVASSRATMPKNIYRVPRR